MNTLHKKQEYLKLLRTKLREIVPVCDAGWSDADPLFHIRSFAGGEHVIEAGDVVTKLHFLLGGIARYY